MIKKLFGETEEQQFEYLKKRLFAFAIGVAILLIGGLLMGMGVPFGTQIAELGTMVCAIVWLVFGWAIMKGVFGFATFGAVFSRNVVIGVVIFVLFITIGYFGGIFVTFIGLCRFFVLLKKRKGNN